MWRNTVPLSSDQLREFETTFHFSIAEPFRTFLIEHNGGTPVRGSIPTSTRERTIECFLDFADRDSVRGAWSENLRLRKQLGTSRIIVGRDVLGNFICLERNYKQQSICVWSHISNSFDPCLLDIPALLRAIN